MKSFHLFLFVVLASACAKKPTPGVAQNRWSDERLWPVLEAQEHRDNGKLCALLGDSSALVREVAAFAFASTQDSASRPCLLKALGDDAPAVRSNAAFALGFVADSASVAAMAMMAVNEKDTVVQRAMLSAAFIAMQRNGLLKDPNAILYYMDHARGHECARAADALRRLPDSLVLRAVSEIDARMATQETDARQFLILAMRKFGEQANRALIGRIAVENSRKNERVSAQRVYGKLYQDEGSEEVLLSAPMCAAENEAVLEALRGREQLDARVVFGFVDQYSDTLMKVGLLELVLRHSDGTLADTAHLMLERIGASVHNPFLRAAVINAQASKPQDGDFGKLMALLRSDAHPAERQAALQGAIAIVRERMKRARYASRDAQYAELGTVVKAAINTNDAGLICAAAELLQEEEADVIRILLPKELEQIAFAPLQPIRDLEARQLLQQATAKRDGLPAPTHEHPASNHPIDKNKLRALKQGLRYRIVTNKGEIVIATDVNECPGSSLAFDSLVTAGYYNGKY
ncbi:MAG TPA: HEAT repeat domain-containing protein, partial [Flavobacteriales bacterium]|nr:HEAT repeat domain-containing protein [Flavobacteriales bacterium]